MSDIIIGKDAADTARMLQRRQDALKVVDHLLKLPRPDRWIAARNVWVSLRPANALAHAQAIDEVKQERIATLDPKYGRTKAALGKAHGTRRNGATSNRLVAIFPEPDSGGGLMDWLKRVDPEFLAMPSGVDYKLNWRKVYKVFPEYVVPEIIEGYDTGVQH